jgi:hypothetical protein
MIIAAKLMRRLERLEEQMSPNAESIIIDVEFVGSAKEPKRGFQVKIPMTGHAREGRRPTRRFGDDGWR